MKNAHSITHLFAHLVLVTKYRKNYELNADFLLFGCNCAKIRVINLGISKNHCHILFEYNSKQNIAKIVEIIKSLSSRRTRISDPINWIGWQNGYFCSSVGFSQFKKVSKYISDQT